MTTQIENLQSNLSRIIDQHPGLNDPLSCDLYDWNERAKRTSNLIDEFKETVFVDWMGATLTTPVITERLLLKKDRNDLSGEEVATPMVWNLGDLISYGHLSKQNIPFEERSHDLATQTIQTIEWRSHNLAKEILQIPGVQEVGVSEEAIEYYSAEDEKSKAGYKKELINMNKMIKNAIETTVTKAETRSFLKVSKEKEENRLKLKVESEDRIVEAKAAAEKTLEETIKRFTDAQKYFDEIMEKGTARFDAQRAGNNQATEDFLKKYSIKCKEEIEIDWKEKALKRIEEDITRQEAELKRLQEELRRRNGFFG